MILNDMDHKIEEKYFREITIEGEHDGITYIFPSTLEFISVIKRKLNKELIQDKWNRFTSNYQKKNKI